MEEKSFKFSKEDENKEYGIKKYFEEVLKTEDRIKSVGIITSDNYAFYMFDVAVDHIVYCDKYSEDKHTDKVMFTCDNCSGMLTLMFNCKKQGEIADLFIGKTMIEIIKEYKEFILEHKDELNFKKISFDLNDNFYRENKTDNSNLPTKTCQEIINQIDSSINSLNTEVSNAEEEIKKNKKREINPMYKILKKYL